MTQNSSKWILNTTLKKMTFLIFLTPPPKMTNVIFFFNEGFPNPQIPNYSLENTQFEYHCPPFSLIPNVVNCVIL